MKKYKVKITDAAIEQMQETTQYISRELHARSTAIAWLNRLKKELFTLAELPNRYPLTEEEPWHSEGVHKMIFENFFVYYWVDEEMAIVWVSGVIYGRRDQLSALMDIQL